MATTYTLISSNVLTGSAASVTFSSIPSTYTDLVLRVSVRASDASVAPATYLTFNSDAIGAANYSYTLLSGNGSAASSTRATNYGAVLVTADGNSATASTFSNSEIYIPNYATTSVKPISVFQAIENNAATASLGAVAELYGTTTAISAINLYPNSTFLAGSSFYLYGIKNS